MSAIVKFSSFSLGVSIGIKSNHVICFNFVDLATWFFIVQIVYFVCISVTDVLFAVIRISISSHVLTSFLFHYTSILIENSVNIKAGSENFANFGISYFNTDFFAGSGSIFTVAYTERW